MSRIDDNSFYYFKVNSIDHNDLSRDAVDRHDVRLDNLGNCGADRHGVRLNILGNCDADRHVVRLNSFSRMSSRMILAAIEKFGAPMYLYDENYIIDMCKIAQSAPNAYGITVRYAMKANPNRALLQLICSQGLSIDASSLNEVRRAEKAGIRLNQIILTTQDVPESEDRADLEQMIKDGLIYNVCSLRQLYLIGDFAAKHRIGLSIRIHPGIGAGESSTRNTGDDYSCFGVHLSDLGDAIEFANDKNIKFTQVHTHIGSGGDPDIWKLNIDVELEILEKYFPDAVTVNFGGGFKVARMPDEKTADIHALGSYAAAQIESFYQKTGRKLRMEIEPGSFIIANSGYLITKIIDKKQTGSNGLSFIITNGGMEANTRPLLYGSRHPFYIVSKTGDLLSSEFDMYPDVGGGSSDNGGSSERGGASESGGADRCSGGGGVGAGTSVDGAGGGSVGGGSAGVSSVGGGADGDTSVVKGVSGASVGSVGGGVGGGADTHSGADTSVGASIGKGVIGSSGSAYEAVVVGRCCESGDSQCLDAEGKNIPRRMVEPEIGYILIIGGTGAYGASMSPFNYNSYAQIPEVLYTRDGELRLIRKRQSLDQIIENEL